MGNPIDGETSKTRDNLEPGIEKVTAATRGSDSDLPLYHSKRNVTPILHSPYVTVKPPIAPGPASAEREELIWLAFSEMNRSGYINFS
jgi:hypothetical protein